MNKLLSYHLGVLLLFLTIFFLNECVSDDDVPTETDDGTANYLFSADDKCIGRILEEYKDPNTDRDIVYFLQSDKDYVATVNKKYRAYEVGVDGLDATSVFKLDSSKSIEEEVTVSNDVSDLIHRKGDHAGIFFRIRAITDDGYVDYYSGDSENTQGVQPTEVRVSYSATGAGILNNAYFAQDCTPLSPSCVINITDPVVFKAHHIQQQDAIDSDVQEITGFPSLFPDEDFKIMEKDLSFTCNSTS